MVSFKVMATAATLATVGVTASAATQSPTAAETIPLGRMTIRRFATGYTDEKAGAGGIEQCTEDFALRPANGNDPKAEGYIGTGAARGTDMMPFELHVLPASNGNCVEVRLPSATEEYYPTPRYIRYQCGLKKTDNSTMSVFANSDDCEANANAEQDLTFVSKEQVCRTTPEFQMKADFSMIETYTCSFDSKIGATVSNEVIVVERQKKNRVFNFAHMLSPRNGMYNENDCQACQGIFDQINEEPAAEGLFHYVNENEDTIAGLTAAFDAEANQAAGTVNIPSRNMLLNAYNLCKPVIMMENEGNETSTNTMLYYVPELVNEEVFKPKDMTLYDDMECTTESAKCADFECDLYDPGFLMKNQATRDSTVLFKDDGMCFTNGKGSTEKVIINPVAIRGTYVGALHNMCATPLTIEFPVVFLAVFIVMFLASFVMLYIHVNTRRKVWAEAEREMLGKVE